MIARALAAALALALLLAGWQWREATAARAETAKVQGQFDAFKLAAADQAVAALNANALETARRLKVQSEVIHAEVQKSQAATAAAARAAAADRGLRSETDRLAARGRAIASDPGAGHDGQAAGSAVAVLADLLGQCSERRQELASYADRAAAAGRVCQRSYEALTP